MTSSIGFNGLGLSLPPVIVFPACLVAGGSSKAFPRFVAAKFPASHFARTGFWPHFCFSVSWKSSNSQRPPHSRLSFLAISAIAFLALSNAALSQPSKAFDALPGGGQAFETLTPGELTADAGGAGSINVAAPTSAASFSDPTAQAPAEPHAAPLDIDAALADLLRLPDCPFDRIREAYEHVVTDQDVFNSLAITEQVLLLCRERQAEITGYIEGTKDIMDGLREAALSSEALVAAQNKEQTLKAEIDALLATKTRIKGEIAEARRIQAALSTTTTPAPNPGSAHIADLSSERASTRDPAAQAKDAQSSTIRARYSLIATTGFGEDAQALLLDAERGESLHAKPGDILPGGATIKSISGLSVFAHGRGGSFEIPIAKEETALQADQAIGGIVWREVGAKPTPAPATTNDQTTDLLNLPASDPAQAASAQTVTTFEGYSQ